MAVQRIHADRVFDGHEFRTGVDVLIDGSKIVAVQPATPNPDVELGNVLLAPGLVDVHCHGGGGVNFTDDAERALLTHRAAGTTTMVASLVTGTLDALEQQVRELSPMVAAGELAGIHLEGPWLAEKYKGAHPAARLADPHLPDVQRLVEAGNGSVRMVTLAVERNGAVAATRWLAEQGVVAALGHSDSSYEDAQEAIAAGVTGATHLFNAMPPMLHRAPGPILALLDSPQVWCELIFDGVHVRPELLAHIMRVKDRVVLITDAMAAAGCSDGHYMLGELGVTVTDSVARIDDNGAIAGSTLVLSRAVRNAITAGVDELTALRAATTNPAAYLSLDGVGQIAPGFAANLVVFTHEYEVETVCYQGTWA